MSLNKVMLIGNLGKDVELKYTPSGVAVATFSLATSEKFKDKNGDKKETTEWHNIVVWRQLAEICGHWLKKGSQIYLEGKIQTRNYDDRDGNKKYITEIVGDQMRMLGAKPEQHSSVSTNQQPASSGQPQQDHAPFDPDQDAPF